MRTRRGFRMILHAENRMIAVAHPFHSMVVQIDVGYFHIRRERIRIDRKTVIL